VGPLVPQLPRHILPDTTPLVQVMPYRLSVVPLLIIMQ